jgi:predicted dehydrogenase
MGQCAHLANYGAIEGCEIAALAEPRVEVAERVAQRYGVDRTYYDHTELLANEALDGIVCIQPFSRHGLILPAVLEAGVPVLTEKPIASSLEVAERLLGKAAQKNAVWMVGYHKRSDPATVCAKSEIDRLKSTGELGDLRYVRITMPPGDWIAEGFRDLIHGEDAGELETDPRPAGMDEATFREYRTFVNYYIHQINLMRHLLGESYRVAFADKARTLVVVESKSGVTGVIEMSPYQTTVDWRESALVGFERGYVRLDLPAPLAVNRPGRVEFLRDPGGGTVPEKVVPQLPWVHAMRRQAENFIAVVKGEMSPPCDASEGLEDLKNAMEWLNLIKDNA